MKRKDNLKRLREMDVTALRSEARLVAEENMRNRFKAGTGTLEKSHVMRQARRTLARIETILAEKSKVSPAQ